ncbi:hypothetical protein V8G54_008546 [Vigna mungo]|uniref:Integrase catalytic domain-containing protein n=1 Tax=Vigna mungo TaxID=3915 RepID=A0AAQ3P3P2_VIGMU
MVENTRLRDLQITVNAHAEEIRCIGETMESYQEQNLCMEQIQASLTLLLQNDSHLHGSTSTKTSSPVNSTNVALPIRDILLGFPHFDGTTPVLEWIFKVENFFNYYNTLEDSRVDIATMHFDKEVVPWFQMLHKMVIVNTWSALTQALESQFGPSPFDCPMAKLFKLQQGGSVSDYYVKFMSLANRSVGLTDEALLNCFLSGLHVEIKRYVLALSPPTLLRAVALAKLFEERYIPAPKTSNTTYTTRYSRISAVGLNSTGQTKSLSQASLPPLLPTPTGPLLRQSGVKKISPAEMQLRRDKELCYFCDDKFTFNHKCLNRQFLLLQLDVDEGEEFVSCESQPITEIEGVESSNNFLPPRIAKFLKLPVEPAPFFKVMVGNGNYMIAEGVIRDLKVQAQGNIFHLPVFLLPISGADLILGACWLKTIGPHIADYDALQLKFIWNGLFTTLLGEPLISPECAQLNHIRRMINTKSIAEVYSMQLINDSPQFGNIFDLLDSMDPELVALLNKYHVVFEPPTALPPSRSHDHSIPLLEGSLPVKVKPYRYPHSQKEEIENLVKGLLEDGLIRSTTFQSLMNDIFAGFLRKFVLQHQLYAKFSKCSFGVQKIDYLGHTILGNGVAMDNSKLEVVQKWPQPSNVKHLRAFLGLTSYYRRFDAFRWTSIASTAFNNLKSAMTLAQVLAMPNFKVPFVLETDASGSGIGASAYTREFYAITTTLAKFRHYLLGHKFIIKTNQKSLKELLDQFLLTPEQQQWLPKFLGYDFTIQYIPGKENVPAYALSRSLLMAFSEPVADWSQRLIEFTQQDANWLQLYQDCLLGKLPSTTYTIKEGLLFYKYRIVLPNIASLLHQIMIEYHSSKIGGHAGFRSTLARIVAHFYWPKMRNDIQKFVNECLVCQQAKTANMVPAGLLQPLPIPHQIWEEIAMDFITQLPMSQGFTTIFVVIDRLSKFGHFIPMKSDFNSQSVAEAFISYIVRIHGFPKSIVSDRDRVFMGAFWKQMFKAQGTTLSMSSSYDPQSDGQTENLNRTIEMYLRCFIYDNPKKWISFLPWAQLWYNTSFHHNLGMTPFQAVFGRLPQSIIRYELQPSYPLSLQEILKARNQLLTQQHSVALRKHSKLGLHYFGPFEVVQKIGLVAYKLKLPDSARIHLVFHVSLLKKYCGQTVPQYLPFPLTSTELGPILQPVAVLASHMIQQDHGLSPQILVQWEGTDPANAT